MSLPDLPPPDSTAWLPDPKDPDYLLAVEAAKILRVSPHTVARTIRRGELRATKINHRYRIPTKDVRALLVPL